MLKELHSKYQWHAQILTKYSSIWFNTYLYLTCFQHHKLSKQKHNIRSITIYEILLDGILLYDIVSAVICMVTAHWISKPFTSVLLSTSFIWLYFYHMYPLKYHIGLKEQGVLNLAQTRKLYQLRIVFSYKKNLS